MHVVVVDDNSPDGTADSVRVLQTLYGNVHLIQGQKAGLGAGYSRGMRYALDVLSAGFVSQFGR